MPPQHQKDTNLRETRSLNYFRTDETGLHYLLKLKNFFFLKPVKSLAENNSRIVVSIIGVSKVASPKLSTHFATTFVWLPKHLCKTPKTFL